MDCSTPGFPVHQFLKIAQTHVHRVGDAIQPSHPLLSPSAFNLSQHLQSFLMSQLFEWGRQRIGASASSSALPMNIHVSWWFMTNGGYITCFIILFTFANTQWTTHFVFQYVSIAHIFFYDGFIYFHWLITLQYCSGFCHTLTWISHGCTCVPHPEPPSRLPPLPIPQGHPSAPAPSTLSHASNLDWRFVSHIIYMFQCYSLKSSHPRLLPQSPKVCSLYLCLFCCFAYTVIVTIFLNSIYIH